LFGEKVRSASECMITGTQGCVGPHPYSSIQTYRKLYFIYLLKKKFLLALIFGLLNTTQTWLEKLGCYSSSLLKKNLVSRFLSVVVRGAETKLELGFKGFLF
jgi:hypothetical protein